jgi:hypothetical protein
MRPRLHTHSTLAHLLDADLLAALSQVSARAHLGVQELLAYRRGQRGTRVRSAPGSGACARSGRARLPPLCACRMLGSSLSGAQVA